VGYLFSEVSFYDVAEHLNAEMKDAVEQLSRDGILSVSENDLVAHLVSRFTLDLPRLLRDSMQVEQQEVKIDVSGDRDTRKAGFCECNPYVGDSSPKSAKWTHRATPQKPYECLGLAARVQLAREPSRWRRERFRTSACRRVLRH
jgi:hypothetical protein